MFFFLDLLGAVLTLLTLLFLGVAGYLAAVLALRERARTDPLALASAAVLAAAAGAGAVGLVLGFVGLLWNTLGIAVLAAATLVLLRLAKRSGNPWEPARLLARRVRARVVEHPVAALIAVHAAGTEALRGLFRPPLSWDSLMYHLLITGTWLKAGRIAPVFGARPMNFYGYQPAGGSVWLWWWMAPSNSELYVNLAFFPQAVLLALAVGGVARELGARRHWPLASYLAFLAPVVIRFAATQYVDILVGAGIVAATFFVLLWLREPRTGPALLAGAGLGLAAGAKVLGLAYVLALVPAGLLMARGQWRRRILQAAGAAAVCALLGSPFYLQNIAAGAGPLAARCDSGPGMSTVKVAPTIPRANTVAALLPEMIHSGWLLDAFLGVTYPGSLELGLGPQTFLLLPGLFLPLFFPRGARRWPFLVWSQIAAELFIWVTVPYASSGHVFANVRYLVGAVGLCFAGVVALAERRGMGDAWLKGLTLVLLIQDLLMLHAEMPLGVRLVIGAVDVLAVALAFSPGLRATLVRHRRALAAAAVALAVAAAPSLSRFRAADRLRAFEMEFTAHKTAAHEFAKAWGWLDRFGGNGTVAVESTPINYFVYPVMGLHLERKAVYVNVNRRNARNAADYPDCEPRVDFDPQAWIDNLSGQDVRWIVLNRFPGESDFPVEYTWAVARPDLFALRFEDPADAIFEFLPWRAKRLTAGRAAGAPPGSADRSPANAG
jgi:hypothetical protein